MSSQDTTSSIWETSSFESNPFLEEKFIPVVTVQKVPRSKFLCRCLPGNFTGWRLAVICGCAFTVLALICNIAVFGVLIWASTEPKSGVSNGSVLYEGDCETTKSIITWSHLAINIISTLILSSSNYAMQILMAPNRWNVNIAHRRGRSVAIGVPNLTNWRYIGRRRQLLFIGLLVTSIPFHTVYNSVVFNTTCAVDFDIHFVTENFFIDIAFNPYNGSIFGEALNNWDNLTTEDCCSKFSPYYINDYTNVILVTNMELQQHGWTAMFSTKQSSQSLDNAWLSDCSSLNNLSTSQTDNWNLNSLPNSSVTIQYCMSPPDMACFMDQSPQPFSHSAIQYCLAKSTLPCCTVELALELLGVAIACNIIKLFILMLLLRDSLSTPLVTIGDAIASFVDEPDPQTKGWGATSLRGSHERQLPEPVLVAADNPWLPPTLVAAKTRKELTTQPWSNKRFRYFSGAKLKHWIWTVFFCLSYLIFGVVMALRSSVMGSPEELQSVWQDGLGSVVPQRLEAWNLGFFVTVIIANLPQLFLSLVYLSYNSLLTSMLLCREWTNYAQHRKNLRVTNPVGEQRSTYFLTLPYKFSMPLLAASALLHWSLSQSIFYAQVNYSNSNGDPDPDLSVLSIGYSIVGLLIALFIGLVMMLALILLGFRHYKSGIPLVLSDSRAISAACHPVAQIARDELPSLEKLQYGVIAHLEQRRYHVGFSSGPVEPLQEGEFYNYRGLWNDSPIIQAER